jgi:CRISPR system Cascade subunit CasD
MGVRIEQEGNKECDFHTVRNYYRASGDFESEKSIISYRYFLSDAQFIVGLEGGDEKIEILKQIHAALRKPRFQLYLGRKSFVPSRPVYLKDGFKEGVSLESALKSYPMKFFGEKKEKIPDKKECRIVVEMPIEKILGDPECNYNYHLDQPTEFCFAPECHKFSERCVVFQDAVVSVVYGGEI